MIKVYHKMNFTEVLKTIKTALEIQYNMHGFLKQEFHPIPHVLQVFKYHISAPLNSFQYQPRLLVDRGCGGRPF